MADTDIAVVGASSAGLVWLENTQASTLSLHGVVGFVPTARVIIPEPVVSVAFADWDADGDVVRVFCPSLAWGVLRRLSHPLLCCVESGMV
jgi:hypothetical protein